MTTIDKKVYLTRQQRVVESFSEGIEALLVTNLSNVRYLTGFSGSAGTVILGKHKTVFISDFRYKEQSENEVGNAAEIVIFETAQSTSESVILDYLKKSSIKTLGIESTMTLDMFESFSKSYFGTLKTTYGLVEKVREIKGEEEMKSLRKAFAIADKSFAKLLKYIKPGKTEIEIAARLEYIMRTQGSSGPSFDTIVASGERSSCPHAQPTERKLKSGEMLKIDFGAVWNGYHSDMTRTLFIGKADNKFREVYETVLGAQKSAVKALRPGAVAKDVDAVAREYIASKRNGNVFGHALGHAVGLDIHESPTLSRKCNAVLRAGVVMTVEPGIYIPGWGGVRIEDVYRIDDELERLTNTPNDLLELPA